MVVDFNKIVSNTVDFLHVLLQSQMVEKEVEIEVTLVSNLADMVAEHIGH